MKIFNLTQDDVKIFDLFDVNIIDLANNLDILENYVKNIYIIDFYNNSFNIEIIDIFVNTIDTTITQVIDILASNVDIFDIDFSCARNLITNICLQ